MSIKSLSFDKNFILKLSTVAENFKVKEMWLIYIYESKVICGQKIPNFELSI
jgi:hypothetical protein